MHTSVRSVFVAAALIIGCTAPPATNSSPPTQTAAPSTATLVAGFVPFQSRALPYSACYPQGWQVREDWLTVGGGRGDAFVGGVPRELPEVMSIVGEPAPGYDTARYVEDALTNLRSEGRGVEDLGATTADGVLAEKLRFSRLTASDERYVVQQIIWARGGTGWILSVASPASREDSWSAALAVVAACFSSSQ